MEATWVMVGLVGTGSVINALLALDQWYHKTNTSSADLARRTADLTQEIVDLKRRFDHANEELSKKTSGWQQRAGEIERDIVELQTVLRLRRKVRPPYPDRS